MFLCYLFQQAVLFIWSRKYLTKHISEGLFNLLVSQSINEWIQHRSNWKYWALLFLCLKRLFDLQMVLCTWICNYHKWWIQQSCEKSRSKSLFSFAEPKGIVELSWWCKSKKGLLITTWQWWSSQLRKKQSVLVNVCLSKKVAGQEKCHKWNDQWYLRHRNPG